MVVQADKEKMMTLLKDTITLLCRNGLAYSSEFCVEALIGITLDKNDVMLVSINETVRSAAALQDEEDAAKEAERLAEEEAEQAAVERLRGDTKREGRQHPSSGRKRQSSGSLHMVKSEHDSGGEDNDPGDEDSSLGGPLGGGDYGEDSAQYSDAGGAPPAKRRALSGSKPDDDEMDIIVIKEELDADSWNSELKDSSSGLDASGQRDSYAGVDADLSQVLHTGGFMAQGRPRDRKLSWPGGSFQQPTSSGATSDLGLADTHDPQQGLLAWPSPGRRTADVGLLGGHTAASSSSSSNSNQPFVCHLCQKVLQSKNGYENHMRVHSGSFKYRCELCGKGFLMKGHYVGHMNSHQNIRPFVCVYCQKGFAYKSDLKHHERVCVSQQDGEMVAVVTAGGMQSPQ